MALHRPKVRPVYALRICFFARHLVEVELRFKHPAR